MAEKIRVIIIDGTEVAVTEEVYRAYKRPAWAERKRRKLRKENERSLEAFKADGYEIADNSKSVEQAFEDKLLIAELRKALDYLDDDERALIEALFFNGLTERDLSLKTGIPRPTIHSRKNAALKKIKNFF